MRDVEPVSRLDYDDELRTYNQLLKAAILVSHDAGGIKTSKRYILSTQIYTRMVVIAYTFFRLLPGNSITRDREEFWDWPTVAAVARNFLEAYLHFYYIGVDDVSEEEFDFRLKAMWYHLNSEKYRMFKSGPRKIDLTSFEKHLPEEKQILRDHPFFYHLTKHQQKSVMSGKSPTYMTKQELIKRLPFRTEELAWMYRHHSNEVHSTALAFHSQSNERGRGEENDAERSYIVFASWLVRKYLAAAILAMAKIFPNKIGVAEKKAVSIADNQFHKLIKKDDDV